MSSNLAVTGYRGKHLSAVERDSLMLTLENMFTVLVILWWRGGVGKGGRRKRIFPRTLRYATYFYPTHIILIFVGEDKVTSFKHHCI